MDPWVVALLFGSFVALLLLGVPIYLALGVSALVTIVLLDLVPLQVLPSQLFSAFNSFTLLAIPLFILAGNLLSGSTIADRLIDLARVLVGRIRGGLAVVSVLMGVFFAGISGSGPADVGAQGAVMVPPMVRDRYRRAFAAALVAANGAVGIIVPPSIGLILYGVVANVSIGRLFIAGVVPGVLVAASLALVSMFLAKRHDWGPPRGVADAPAVGAGNAEGEAANAGELRAVDLPGGLRRVPVIGRAFRRALLGLLAPVIILGGIYSGEFTPTEAAAVVVVYALVVGMLVYRDTKPRDLPQLLIDSARTTGTVMIIVGSAAIFAFVLNSEGIAAGLAAALSDLAPNMIIGLLLVNLIILLAGTVLDSISIYYILTPILLPVATAFGIDPVHFGIILTVNLAIGQITPPVGVNLFVACGVSGVSLSEISRWAVPLVGAQVVALLVITFVPGVTLWLPDSLGV